MGFLLQDCPRGEQEADEGEVDRHFAGRAHPPASLLCLAPNTLCHACRRRKGVGGWCGLRAPSCGVLVQRSGRPPWEGAVVVLPLHGGGGFGGAPRCHEGHGEVASVSFAACCRCEGGGWGASGWSAVPRAVVCGRSCQSEVAMGHPMRRPAAARVTIGDIGSLLVKRVLRGGGPASPPLFTGLPWAAFAWATVGEARGLRGLRVGGGPGSALAAVLCAAGAGFVDSEPSLRVEAATVSTPARQGAAASLALRPPGCVPVHRRCAGLGVG